ncbi:hypothetical protein NOX90_01815 [Wolbachia endosymbiont of Anurida maritima]|uniref:hypothetical protein n=1 Tax=Wolbachia endosymbiont of Anurida maritima TaxID=2850562 RepID=UPI0035CEC9F4
MKKTFSSEKEKITCKGAMEVAGTQPYKRCNIAQYYTVNDVIPVLSFMSSKCLFSLSSQCVTLGSILFSSWTLYALRICCSLHNLQIFLYLDPSVSYLDYRRVLVDGLGEL